MALNDCGAPASLEPIDNTLIVSGVTIAGVSLTFGVNTIPALLATWSTIANNYIIGLEFEFTGSGLSTGAVTKGVAKAALAFTATDGIVAGADYAVRYRAVGVGIKGPWTSPVVITIPASFIAGTAASVNWSGVTGAGRPADNATVNNVTYSASAPATPINGDIWVDTTTTPYVVKLRVAGVWQVSASLGATFGSTVYETPGGAIASLGDFKTIMGIAASILGQAPAATDGTIAPGANKVTVTVSSTAPVSPVNNDLWKDTSTTPAIWKARVGGAWVDAASLGALFGTTLYESPGVLAALAAFKTALGTAAAIAGQGNFATVSQINIGNVATLLAAQTLDGTQIYALLRLIIGVGAASLNMDGGHATHPFWIGSTAPDGAPFRVAWDGTVDARRFRAYGANDVLLFDSNLGGLTNAGAGDLLSQVQTSFASLADVSGSVAQSVSSGTISSVLAAQLGATSTVLFTGSWQLINAEAGSDVYPASVTLKAYMRYRATSGGAWGAWGQLGTDKTFTKITSGTPTSTQYKVLSETDYEIDDLGGGSYIRNPVTTYRIDSPAALTFSISAGQLDEGFYEFAIVGGTGSPWTWTNTLITLSDTDAEPSWILAGAPLVGKAYYALPSNLYDDLVMKSTGSATLDIDASWVIMRTASGNQITLEPVDLSLNLATTGLNGLDTGALAANSLYHAYVITNGQTTGGIVSLSATAPLLPSGYSYKAIVGRFMTDASGIIRPFVKRGPKFAYVGGAAGLPELATTSGGSPIGNHAAGTYAAVSVSALVPADAIEVSLQIRCGSNTTIVAPNNAFGASDSATNPPPFVAQVGSTIESRIINLALESTNIYWATSAGTSAANRAMIRCAGYLDKY